MTMRTPTITSIEVFGLCDDFGVVVTFAEAVVVVVDCDESPTVVRGADGFNGIDPWLSRSEPLVTGWTSWVMGATLPVPDVEV